MALSVRQRLQQKIIIALDSLYDAGKLEGERLSEVALTAPKQESHGDFACNAALMLSKRARRNPREIAGLLQEALGDAEGMVSKCDIAGPGFLNLFVSNETWHTALADILEAGPSHIRSNGGAGEKILIEFVSANPTGPLHVGHGRGAVAGDITARLLDAAGYKVDREYYVNDLGNQVDVMATSIYLRYGELFGHSFDAPEDFYPGDYIVDIAQEIKSAVGDKFVGVERDKWLPVFKDKGIELMLKRIREDLDAFGIRFDNWTSEKELTERVGLDGALDKLKAGGFIYEEEGKQWFKTTEFGDDKDRVVRRDDGRTTYFASDIAYHDDKMNRGYTKLINVLGADHGGYVARLKAGLEACGHGKDVLETIFVQIVSLSRGGEEVKMGKRLGTAIWLQDIIDEAGRDATRYFFAMRRCEAQMEFDLDLATKKSNDNPVFYAQMGHARLCSIFRKAKAEGVPEAQMGEGALAPLLLPEEIGLIKKLSKAPELIAHAAQEREPHQVVHYVQETIALFHSYFSKYRGQEKVVSEDAAKTRARLLLCRGLQTTLRAMLEDILGVSAPQEMYLES